MIAEQAKSAFAYGWMNYAREFLGLYGQNENKSRALYNARDKNQESKPRAITGRDKQKSIVGSIVVAFLIVYIAAQTLGLINNFIETNALLEFYKGANVILYSNIG